MPETTQPYAPTTTPDVTVTTVRKALIDESYEHHAAIKRLTAKARELRATGEKLTEAEFDLIETLTGAAAYSYLLAVVLRQIEAFSGTDEATVMAELFHAVMDAGIEVLEDANGDLDERTSGDAVAALDGDIDGEATQFPTVTICGSMRFYPRMLKLAAELTSSGRIVLMPHDASLTGIPDKTALEHGAMLDAMHRAKIRMSGSVHVVNTGGYIGESTRSEIAYATSLGIAVEYDEAVSGE